MFSPGIDKTFASKMASENTSRKSSLRKFQAAATTVQRNTQYTRKFTQLVGK